MKLIEADAKQLLENHGLAVPPGRVLARSLDDVASRDTAVAIKAQILAGGRGKAGLVQLASREALPDRFAAVAGAMKSGGHDPLLLVEDQVAIAAEYYLAWRIDDIDRKATLMFSTSGGVEVEANAEALREVRFEPLLPVRLDRIAAFLSDCGVEGPALGPIARFALDLHQVFEREDATLIEINPLVLTEQGRAVAVDAKMILDENAARRHGEWKALASYHLQNDLTDVLEIEAAQNSITFVSLPGNVALVSGGAGVGMTIVDLLADNGLAAANFADLPGGSGAQAFGALTRLILKRAADSEVEAILIFLTLSATSLKQPVESILAALDEGRPAQPVIVGIVAGGSAEREMSHAAAVAAFQDRGYKCVDDLDSAVAAVRAAIR